MRRTQPVVFPRTGPISIEEAIRARDVLWGLADQAAGLLHEDPAAAHMKVVMHTACDYLIEYVNHLTEGEPPEVALIGTARGMSPSGKALK